MRRVVTCHVLHSHVALSQSLVHRQQAGDLLDDDLPGQFDGPVAVVRPLSLRLEPTGFLTNGQTDRQKEEEKEGDGRPEGTKHHRIKSGRHEGGSHCETLTDSGQTADPKSRLLSSHNSLTDKVLATSGTFQITQVQGVRSH